MSWVRLLKGPAYAKQVKPAEYFEDKGSTGLNYNTPYTVAKTDFANYNYYGSYIVNDGSLTVGDAATVTLTAANSNQHVWFAYTKSFNVAHVQFDETETNAVVTETTTHTVELFNLTSVVSNGFIYGGAFSDAACETVQTFAEGQNATAFTPTAGATYYIWEADAQFLSPKNLSCWNHVSAADVDVTGFYLVTPVESPELQGSRLHGRQRNSSRKAVHRDLYNGVRCGEHSGSYRQRLLCLQHRKSRFQQWHKRYVQCFKRYQ